MILLLKIIFAFWGAEEIGLRGSQYFVNSLSEEERDDIALNLNFDMIASPNYVRGVYNGSGVSVIALVSSPDRHVLTAIIVLTSSILVHFIESRGHSPVNQVCTQST